jgi:hypothetical protein
MFSEELLVSDGGSHRQPGIVLVRDIQFAALSADTLMPFHGKAHLAYLPSNGTVLGLSKLARLVLMFSKRLQLQVGSTYSSTHSYACAWQRIACWSPCCACLHTIYNQNRLLLATSIYAYIQCGLLHDQLDLPLIVTAVHYSYVG